MFKREQILREVGKAITSDIVLVSLGIFPMPSLFANDDLPNKTALWVELGEIFFLAIEGKPFAFSDHFIQIFGDYFYYKLLQQHIIRAESRIYYPNTGHSIAINLKELDEKSRQTFATGFKNPYVIPEFKYNKGHYPDIVAALIKTKNRLEDENFSKIIALILHVLVVTLFALTQERDWLNKLEKIQIQFLLFQRTSTPKTLAGALDASKKLLEEVYIKLHQYEKVCLFYHHTSPARPQYETVITLQEACPSLNLNFAPPLEKITAENKICKFQFFVTRKPKNEPLTKTNGEDVWTNVNALD